jgi:hypothetical protein
MSAYLQNRKCAVMSYRQYVCTVSVLRAVTGVLLCTGACDGVAAA